MWAPAAAAAVAAGGGAAVAVTATGRSPLPACQSRHGHQQQHEQRRAHCLKAASAAGCQGSGRAAAAHQSPIKALADPISRDEAGRGASPGGALAAGRPGNGDSCRRGAHQMRSQGESSDLVQAADPMAPRQSPASRGRRRQRGGRVAAVSLCRVAHCQVGGASLPCYEAQQTGAWRSAARDNPTCPGACELRSHSCVSSPGLAPS